MAALRKQSQLRSLDLSHNMVCCLAGSVRGFMPRHSCACVLRVARKQMKLHTASTRGARRVFLIFNVTPSQRNRKGHPCLRMMSSHHSIASEASDNAIHCDQFFAQIDERTLREVAELLHRNSRLASVNLADNRISCNEFEPCGLDVMRLLSSNNTITVRYDEN